MSSLIDPLSLLIVMWKYWVNTVFLNHPDLLLNSYVTFAQRDHLVVYNSPYLGMCANEYFSIRVG